MAGWLGPWKPFEIQQVIEHTAFPCHKTVSEAGMPDNDPRLKMCAGAAIFLNNKCAISRNRTVAAAQKSLKTVSPEVKRSVFANSVEFLMHHMRESRKAILAKLRDQDRFL